MIELIASGWECPSSPVLDFRGTWRPRLNGDKWMLARSGVSCNYPRGAMESEWAREVPCSQSYTNFTERISGHWQICWSEDSPGARLISSQSHCGCMKQSENWPLWERLAQHSPASKLYWAQWRSLHLREGYYVELVLGDLSVSAVYSICDWSLIDRWG